MHEQTQNKLIQEAVKFFFQANNKIKGEWELQKCYPIFADLLAEDQKEVRFLEEFSIKQGILEETALLGEINGNVAIIICTSLELNWEDELGSVLSKYGLSRGFIGKIGKRAQVRRFDYSS
ncbi:MAG: hypothetical protein AAFY71_10370 [Bacteroidota bacterium]